MHQYLTTDGNLDVCGPKGGRLLEIYHLGLPVPPLVCVPAAVYREHVSRIEEFRQYFLGTNCEQRDVSSTMAVAARIRSQLLTLDLDAGLQRDVEVFFQQVPGGSVGMSHPAY
jgi:phosphoenolpyruvate synthase/pyruvate phosphate dikinase